MDEALKQIEQNLREAIEKAKQATEDANAASAQLQQEVNNQVCGAIATKSEEVEKLKEEGYKLFEQCKTDAMNALDGTNAKAAETRERGVQEVQRLLSGLEKKGHDDHSTSKDESGQLTTQMNETLEQMEKKLKEATEKATQAAEETKKAGVAIQQDIYNKIRESISMTEDDVQKLKEQGYILLEQAKTRAMMALDEANVQARKSIDQSTEEAIKLLEDIEME